MRLCPRARKRPREQEEEQRGGREPKMAECEEQHGRRGRRTQCVKLRATWPLQLLGLLSLWWTTKYAQRCGNASTVFTRTGKSAEAATSACAHGHRVPESLLSGGYVQRSRQTHSGNRRGTLPRGASPAWPRPREGSPCNFQRDNSNSHNNSNGRETTREERGTRQHNQEGRKEEEKEDESKKEQQGSKTRATERERSQGRRSCRQRGLFSPPRS